MRQGRTLRTAVIALGLATVAAKAEDAALPDAMRGVRVAPMLLLSRPDVRADLALTADQVASASRVLDEIRSRARSIRGQGDTPEVVARRRAIDEIQWRWLAEELSDEQQARLSQIDLQWEGATALTRPSVAERLGLSDSQSAALRRAVAEKARAGASSEPTPGADPVTRSGDRERARFEASIAVLTAEQRDRWKAMLGKPLVVGAGRRDPAVRTTSGPAKP